MAVKRVKEAFSYDDASGVPVVMVVGQLVDTSHPSYSRERDHLFESVESAAVRAVETTTAAPGEARVLSKGRRSINDKE